MGSEEAVTRADVPEPVPTLADAIGVVVPGARRDRDELPGESGAPDDVVRLGEATRRQPHACDAAGRRYEKGTLIVAQGGESASESP
jgi:hypothetical protein